MSSETPDPNLSADDYLDHLLADLAAISAIPHAGLDVAVPSCPLWTVSDAVAHLAGVLDVSAGRVTTPVGGQAPGPVGRGDSSVLDYFSAAASRLIAALEATDPSAPRPNWSGDDRAFFYWRRLTHETLIHRWDIESAIGDAAPIDPRMAIDGLDELFSLVLPASGERLGLPTTGATVHFHVTETDETLPAGEWTSTFGTDGVITEPIHGKGDVAYRGRAADLVLFAWNRSTTGVEAFGDGDALGWWARTVAI